MTDPHTERRGGHSPPRRRRWGIDASLIAQMAILAAAMSGVRPLASYRALALDATSTEIALLAASFAVGPLLFAMVVGRVVDRVGPGRVLALFSALTPLALLGTVLANQLWQLLVSCALLGAFQVSILVSLQALAAHGRRGTQLDRAFGSLTASASIGQAAGPALALALPSLLPVAGNTPIIGLLLLVFLSLGGALTGVTYGLRQPRPVRLPDGSPRESAFGILRRQGMPAALLASGVVLACVDLLAVFVPVWAQKRGVDELAVAILLVVRGVVTLASRLTIGVVVARASRKQVVAGSSFAAAIGFALLPYVGFLGALPLMVLLGFGLGMVQPLTLAWVAAGVGASSRGAALGLRMVSNRLFQTVLPLGVGALAQPLALVGSPAARSLWVASSALLASSAAVCASSWVEGELSAAGDPAAPNESEPSPVP